MPYLFQIILNDDIHSLNSLIDTNPSELNTEYQNENILDFAIKCYAYDCLTTLIREKKKADGFLPKRPRLTLSPTASQKKRKIHSTLESTISTGNFHFFNALLLHGFRLHDYYGKEYALEQICIRDDIAMMRSICTYHPEFLENDNSIPNHPLNIAIRYKAERCVR